MSDTIDVKQESAEMAEQSSQLNQFVAEPPNAESTPINAEPTTAKAEPKSKKKKWLVWVIILSVMLVLAVLAAAAYFYMADYYKTRFLPGTTINGMVCDKMEVGEVAALLESQPLTYDLTVTGQAKEVIGKLDEEDIGLRFVSTLENVEQILGYQNSLYWPFAYVGRYESSHDLDCGTEYDKEAVLASISAWEALDEEKMETPQNAYISEYQSKRKGYEIVPELLGNTLDVEKAKELILAAVEERAETLNLAQEACYLLPKVTADNAGLKAKCEELNLLLGTKITYDWNGSEVILDGETIKDWIKDEDVVGPEGDYKADVVLDEEAVAAFVAVQAKQYDTYGKHRTFTTALGETIKVLNGGYGWKTNKVQETQELLALIREGAVTEREPVYQVKAAKKGTDDIGSSYVEIDLTNQHLYVHWKGQIVLETDFVSGDMSNGNTTPGGLYRLTYKTTNAVLRGRDYVTPVSYWMPFNGNIGMHDATWRSEFGGDIFMTNGSHGCINLPLDKAQAIYGYVSTGFPIICYYY